MRKKIIYLGVGILLLLIIYGAIKIDFSPPLIKLGMDLKFLSRNQEVLFIIEDTKSGIRSIMITVSQGKLEKEILYTTLSEKGVKKKELTLTVKPRELGFKDGVAKLTVHVKDNSLLGNEATLLKEVTIDTYPPRLEVVSLSHYIKIGGSCLTVYNASNDAKRSGVKVGDHFFKGYLTNFPGIYVAYFALPWDATTSTPITLEAQDRAGNINKLSFPHKILRKKFRSDRITVTDSFLNRKMPEFSEGCERLSGEPLEIYLKVNRELRQKTEQRIENMCQKASTDKKLWKGPFLRMKGSPKSLFGDKRSYYYKGKEIDKQIHLGIDIAALEHFPVGAANNGIVIFSNYLGIYGNSIIIDHGQGLCSLYGHLSTTKIESGNEVKKGDIIGYTGSTGLAGGDHLHFSILVDGMYVNPVEWWDPHWVEDNITEKLR